ncbi:MAG: beta-galactosidase, partial [Luteolibacter sp.]
MKNTLLLAIIGAALTMGAAAAEPLETPFVGAQVFIEPGQTPEQIDGWFALLEQHDMTFCRIRMFETYMHTADGKWDFSLFDQAYRAAEKHGVKI